MRSQLTIFLVVLVITGALSLVYQTTVTADLSRLAAAPDVLSSQLTLIPQASGQAQPVTRAELLDTQRKITQRLEQLRLAEPYQVNLAGDRLEVTLPRNENTPYLINVITSIGRIDFIDGGTSSPPVGQHVQVGPYTRPGRGIYQSLFSGEDIESIAPPDSHDGQIFYRLNLQPAAANRLVNFLADNPKTYICMVLDERVISCSGMYHQEGTTVDILPDLGSGTPVSLADLAALLESGPLPVKLTVE